jgi:hypothetical protein
MEECALILRERTVMAVHVLMVLREMTVEQ